MAVAEGEVLLRLGAALVLCGALGLERESRDEVAGLRTLMLVGVGSAAFTVVSLNGFEGDGGAGDRTRIAAQVVSGVGFLGAGAIVREGFSVRGVTTAAALWISAAVGMAAGGGLYFTATATAGIALVALVLFRRLRGRVARRLGSDALAVDVELESGVGMSDVTALLANRSIRLEDVQFTIAGPVENAHLALRVPAGVDVESALRELAAAAGVTRVSATGMRTARLAGSR